MYTNSKLSIDPTNLGTYVSYYITVIRYIPNEDKTVRLFKNLRLEIFQLYVISHPWLSVKLHMKARELRHFKNLRLKIFQVHVVGHRWHSAITIIPYEDKTVQAL